MTILKRQFPRSLAGRFPVIGAFIIGSATFAQSVAAAPFGRQAEENVQVDLIGYNYTNRHINSYSIDGQGGGDVRLSSHTSGGGGIACCVNLSGSHSKPVIVRVRWQVDGCSYSVRSSITGRKREYRHDFYKEAYVEVPRPQGIDPTHLETHFYPNGSVQLKLTASMSLPRMSLNEQRPDHSQFPRCKDDKKPE